MHISESIRHRSKINTDLESLTFDLQIWNKVKGQFRGQIDISETIRHRSKFNTDLESLTFHLDIEVKVRGQGQSSMQRSHVYLRNYTS